MSQIFKAILAALAVTATFDAVQLASGHDLIGGRQLASTIPAADINRAAKADRAALRAAPGQTETITIRSVGLDDTSVVLRVPVAQQEVRNPPAAQVKPSGVNERRGRIAVPIFRNSRCTPAAEKDGCISVSRKQGSERAKSHETPA